MVLPSDVMTRTSAGDGRSAAKSAQNAIAKQMPAARGSLCRCGRELGCTSKNTVIYRTKNETTKELEENVGRGLVASWELKKCQDPIFIYEVYTRVGKRRQYFQALINQGLGPHDRANRHAPPPI
jgi:hypothetical protein